MADPVIVKFAGLNSETDRLIVGVGLAAETIAQMKGGDPITIRLEDLGLPFVGDLLVIYRETSEELADFIRPTLRPDTVVRINQSGQTTEDPEEVDLLKDFDGPAQ
jgi:hypothetical protein